MTGTVLDGYIDVALLHSDGEHIERFGAYRLVAYDEAINARLREALDAALAWQFDAVEPTVFRDAERRLTDAQADAVAALLNEEGIAHAEVAAVGFHGQTVLHRPPGGGKVGRTRQLGDGERMAARLGIPVVYDFRSADMRAGGQGAPLAPVYHRALMATLRDTDVPAGHRQSSVVLNLGGVGNLTWWDGDKRLLAFDTGPANAPINDWLRRHGLGDYDTQGALAAQGTVDEQRLAELLTHPYLMQAPPKSLDRFDFSWQMADGLSAADGAALLTAFSAASVDRALALLPVRPAQVIVCGGGRHNDTLMREIAARARVEVLPAEAVGWRGDAVEAECFAFLAARHLRGLPSSFTATTGVSEPTIAGVLAACTGESL